MPNHSISRLNCSLKSDIKSDRLLGVHACQLTEIMLSEVNNAEDLSELLLDTRKNAVIAGPGNGVGEKTAGMVLASLSGAAGVVVDADGLTSFENEPERLFEAIRGRKGSTILTPHQGEFARLFGKSGKIKTQRAADAAQKSGAVIVFKGPDTVIAAPDGRITISSTGTPCLATAGSGDVLAGIAGGLLAQSMPAYEAACAAVWIHSAAAGIVGPGLVAGDLVDAIPQVLRQLCESGKLTTGNAPHRLL